MSRYKLIPLNGEFLLIDTQADIVENDYAYEHLIIEADPSNDKKIAINKKAVRQCKWVGNGLIGFTDGDTTGLGWCKKVIASAYIPELPIISKSAIISLYESEHAHELAVKYSLDVENFIGNTGGQYNHCIADFIAGYSANTAKYTEEDLEKHTGSVLLIAMLWHALCTIKKMNICNHYYQLRLQKGFVKLNG